MKLHTKILLGLLLGAILGPLLGDFAIRIKPIGDAFINLLIMIVVPLVMASLIPGTERRGEMLTTGFEGQMIIPEADAIASRTPGAGREASAPRN